MKSANGQRMTEHINTLTVWAPFYLTTSRRIFLT